MRSDDRIRLRHMLDASLEATAFLKGHDRPSLENNRLLTLAVVKSIEIIGEAASKVSADCRREHPGIPWLAIVGMRNRLIHGYFDIDVDRVWDTVADDLPTLISQLGEILKT
jgi:uncharacterized protein with HEPN domain